MTRPNRSAISLRQDHSCSFAPVGKPTDTTASRAVGFSVVFWHFQLPGVPMELFGDDWSFAIATPVSQVHVATVRERPRPDTSRLSPRRVGGVFCAPPAARGAGDSRKRAPPKRGSSLQQGLADLTPVARYHGRKQAPGRWPANPPIQYDKWLHSARETRGSSARPPFIAPTPASRRAAEAAHPQAGTPPPATAAPRRSAARPRSEFQLPLPPLLKLRRA